LLGWEEGPKSITLGLSFLSILYLLWEDILEKIVYRNDCVRKRHECFESTLMIRCQRCAISAVRLLSRITRRK
jgi:hypothetical protein